VSDIPVAFYTPLKHPEEREASGDREIARRLTHALRTCGYAPELASRFLTWRRRFDPDDAVRLERRAAVVAAGLVRRYRRRPAAARPRLWMSYQNYYRCPDLVGPVVATALDVPYVLVDTAVSTSSRRTPFRPWVSAARLALRRADLVFAMSPRDVPRLAALRGRRFAAERIRPLPPAVPLGAYAAGPEARARHRAALAARVASGDGPLLLCVAMMRAADKLDSYRLLAQALAGVSAPWRLVIAGDGPDRPAVEAAFARLPRERVALAGAIEPEALPAFYLGADLFVFPGLGEALGLVYLEAAAAGLPVVACAGPGPAAMVAPEGSVLAEPTAAAFGAVLAALLADPARRAAMGEAGRRWIAAERSDGAFAERLASGLSVLNLPTLASDTPGQRPKAVRSTGGGDGGGAGGHE
jgi:glycosyltransferase involved in cell wall biosynthesis